MTKVLVLAGGNSDERAVSLRSGSAVMAALHTAGYDVLQLDPAEQDIDYGQRLENVDVVLPILHGKGGEDGYIQVWLEKHGMRYAGADAQASAHCFDKWRYKQTLQRAELPHPRGEMVEAETLWQSPLTKKPFVLKPYDGGSSVDTFIIRDVTAADQPALNSAFTRHPKMLLEELIDGQEITVGVLGEHVLPVIEIIPPADAEFDYYNKYNGQTQELCPPLHVSQSIQQRAQALALQIHQLIGVRDMSRTDIMVAKDDSLYVLETNTIPGMTAQSLLPKAAAVAGYDMPAVVHILVRAALSR